MNGIFENKLKKYINYKSKSLVELRNIDYLKALDSTILIYNKYKYYYDMLYRTSNNLYSRTSVSISFLDTSNIYTQNKIINTKYICSPSISINIDSISPKIELFPNLQKAPDNIVETDNLNALNYLENMYEYRIAYNFLKGN